ncbi:hypothetical protein BC826DRAFT_1179044 [Russula brevipes]|nr:hypothetical protein BC826DRAFT_1179044 [Russula brevipes]
MSSHNHAREVVQTDGSSDSEGLAVEERLAHGQEVFDGPQGQATIDDLPDDALLGIFDFYLDDKSPNNIYSADKWHTLVHVCRWWRSVVFSSPRRLDLRLLCTGGRSVRVMLDIWPTLPIQIEYHHDWSRMKLDSIIAALEYPDRVRHISIIGLPSAWEALAAAMQAPLPELTYLRLGSCGTSVSILPGGSTPRLRTLELREIPIPAVLSLIVFAGDLVNLTLYHIPPSGHVSAESMVACLSSLKRLESLTIGFDTPLPDQPGPSPQARAVFPALATFAFRGMNKYLEDFVARIDTPVLTRLHTSFVMDVAFDIPHLSQFIGRVGGLKSSKAVRVSFQSWSIRLEFGSTLRIVRPRTNWLMLISSMAVVCRQLSPLCSLFERLDLMTDSPFKLPEIESIEPTLFFELFRPFTATQDLYVSKSLVPLIAAALQQLIGEWATEVLPELRSLFLAGSVIPGYVQEAIQPFVDARRLSGRPIAIHRWEEEGADG